mmetsp:Transcript_37540/g.77029  ORF Transcript_37540/g.77029 Transcript_37540/m.77029 type:complete len:198 (+) Transcript_37540:359-952(+)
MSSAPVDDALINNFISQLESKGIKAVVFDFDCTITIKHSGGRVRDEKMPAYLEHNISPVFHQLLPSLLSRSFAVGVATFADAYRAPAHYVAGEDLVRKHFEHYFGNPYTNEVMVVAAYPENYQEEVHWRARGLSGPMPNSKEFHLQTLMRKFETDAKQTALVDDDRNNIQSAKSDGHLTVLVRDRQGLMPRDLEAPM